MSADPRHPVIVGVAQRTWRGGDAPSPIEMCAETVTAAAADAGAGDALLRRAGAIGVVDIASRRWNDPAALVAARLGIDAARDDPHEPRRRRPAGARQPPGDADRAGRPRRRDRLRRRGARDARARAARPPRPAVGARRRRRGARPRARRRPRARDRRRRPTRTSIAPIVMYPLFENALWAQEGTTPRRAPRPPGRAVGRLLGGRRGQPARVVARSSAAPRRSRRPPPTTGS